MAKKTGTSAVASAAAEIVNTAPDARGNDNVSGSGSNSSPPLNEPSPHHTDVGGGISAGSSSALESPAGTATDKFGQQWDPAKHAKGSDGKGVLTADGKWRAKRQSRSAVTTSVSAKPGSGSPAPAGIPAVDPAKAAQAGRDCAFAIHSIIGSFGPDWKLTRDEDDAGQQAMSRYFVSRQIGDFPPGVALVLVYGSIMGRRMTMESTTKKVGAIKLRLAAWILKRKLRKQGIVAKVTIEDGQLLVNGKPEAQP